MIHEGVREEKAQRSTAEPTTRYRASAAGRRPGGGSRLPHALDPAQGPAPGGRPDAARRRPRHGAGGVPLSGRRGHRRGPGEGRERPRRARRDDRGPGSAARHRRRRPASSVRVERERPGRHPFGGCPPPDRGDRGPVDREATRKGPRSRVPDVPAARPGRSRTDRARLSRARPPDRRSAQRDREGEPASGGERRRLLFLGERAPRCARKAGCEPVDE